MDELPEGAIPVEQFQDAPDRAPAALPTVNADVPGPPDELATDQPISHAPKEPGSPQSVAAPESSFGSSSVPPKEEISEGAIPIEQFHDASLPPDAPAGAIPIDQFQDASSQIGIGGQAVGAFEQFGQDAGGPLFTAAEQTSSTFYHELADAMPPGPVKDYTEQVAQYLSPDARRAREEATSEFVKIPANIIGFMTGPYSELIKGAGLAGKAVGELSPILSDTAGTIAKYGAEFAALFGGQEVIQKLNEDPNQYAQTAIQNVEFGTALGAVLGIGVSGSSALWSGAVSSLWKATIGPKVEDMLYKAQRFWRLGDPLKPDDVYIAPIIKKALTVGFGVPREIIDAYVENHAEVNLAPNMDDVVHTLVGRIDGVNTELEHGGKQLEAAEQAYADARKNLNDNLKQLKVDATAADQYAENALDRANYKYEANLAQDADSASQDVHQGVQAQKTKAFALLENAENTLKDSDARIDITPVVDEAENLQRKFRGRGLPNYANKIQSAIDGFTHQYMSNDGTVSASDARQMLLGFREMGDLTGANVTEASAGTAGSFNALQGILDGQIKGTVDAYKKAMVPTAEAFDLLGRLSKYGTPDGALRAVRALRGTAGGGSANYVLEMPILKELEESIGQRFTTPIQQYADPELRELRAKHLPEYKTAQTAHADIQFLRSGRTQQMINDALEASREKKELTIAQRDMIVNEFRKKGLNGLTANNIEGAIKRVMGGKSVMAPEKFAGFRGIEGKSVPELLKLLSIRDGFEKNYTNGSRATNMWARAAGGLAAFVSFLSGGTITTHAAATALGAVAGGAIDKFGSGATKAILDKMIYGWGGLPKEIGASPEATRAMMAEFIDSKFPRQGQFNGEAFRAGAKYIDSAKQGGKSLKDNAKSLFDGAKIQAPRLAPNRGAKDLDEKLNQAKKNPTSLFAFGGSVGYYLPKHGEALSKVGARTTGVLNQLRPMPQKNGPLDDEAPVSKIDQQDYMDKLAMAQHPLGILNHIRENTILPQHVNLLKTTYPDLHRQLAKEVVGAMTNHLSEGKTIPYKMRQALSTFIGEPLDSSLSQPRILAAQMTFAPQHGAQAPSQPMTKNVKDTAKLGEAAGQYRTTEQSSIARQSNTEY